MKKILLFVFLSLFLSACNDESDAKKAVLGSLKDPDSAKFGKFTQVNENYACLTVNARNSMGGYTGDQQAALKKANKEWVVSSIEEISHDTCIHVEQQRVLAKRQAEEKLKEQDALYEADIKAHETHLKKCSEINGYPGCPKIVPKDCPNCPDMMEIPTDYFKNVVLLKGFALGKFEVTQGEWKAVMGSNPSKFSNCGDTCPVENVSLDDVKIYLQKLNARTGQKYRLPTEAEWEYACYGGSKSEYCGGNDHDAVGWFGKNSGNTTHPVGQRRANGYGLYDMTGNVSEWMENKYDNEHVYWFATRGGSWSDAFDNPLDASAANRSNASQEGRYEILGFRLARTLP